MKKLLIACVLSSMAAIVVAEPVSPSISSNDKAAFIYLLKQKDSNPSGENFRLLADAYRFGKGTVKSSQNALLYYVKAAELRDADAIWILLDLLDSISSRQLSVLLSQEQLTRAYWTAILLEIGDSRASISHAIQIISDSTRKEERQAQAEIIESFASTGEPMAMKQLYIMYTEGVVYKIDIDKALKWSRQWAEADDTTLGYFHSFKRAMEIDRGKEALDHLEKAATQGSMAAVYNLAKVLEKGHFGVPVDLDKAYELYKTALENGYKLAYESYHHLNALRKSPVLFGVPLYDSDRNQLRSALRAARLKPIRLNWDTFVDIYDPSKALAGANNLSVVYYPEGKQKLAEMVYLFENENSNLRYNQLRQELTNKYGLADRTRVTKSQRRRQKSTLSPSYRWKVGRIHIVLSKTKNKAFKLSYKVHPYIDMMASKIDEYVAQAKKRGKIRGDSL